MTVTRYEPTELWGPRHCAPDLEDRCGQITAPLLAAPDWSMVNPVGENLFRLLDRLIVHRFRYDG